MIAPRDQFGDSLVEWGARDPNLVVLDADLSASTRTSRFAARYPTRFFNMGIAEENMVGVGTGLALAGKTVVVSGFTIFTLGRAWDFIRAAAYDAVPLKICTTHAGFGPGYDGATHQCLEDLALMCSLPNVQVLVPADARETRLVMDHVLSTPGLFYVRLGRNPVPAVTPADAMFTPGRNRALTPGGDVTIFALGRPVGIALEAARLLEADHVRARVVDLCQVKPLDAADLARHVEGARLAVVVEDHNQLTGVGVQVAARLHAPGGDANIPVELLGIPDTFGQSGPEDALLAHHGINASHLRDVVVGALDHRRTLEGAGRG